MDIKKIKKEKNFYDLGRISFLNFMYFIEISLSRIFLCPNYMMLHLSSSTVDFFLYNLILCDEL